MALTSRSLFRICTALWLLGFASATFADPPGRVGRLADLQGQVWLYDAETAEWVAAVRNRPLTNGDRVSTDGNARAEMRIGSTTLRLYAGTEVELLQLDDDRVRVQLHNGLLAVRLRSHETAREFELVTAEGRFKPDRAGRYRLDRLDATSSVTVWSGQLLFEAPDNAVTLVAGQRADILTTNRRTQYSLLQPPRDGFADEVAASERAEERSVSTRYVSPEMTGVEELDRHGRWENDTDYGSLWVPRAVVPGWAPYRFGHWAWVRPWGWTWVDDAAWGFAPFHYGRWVYLRNTWCWSPGSWVARPVYAPALVAWVGAPQTGVSINIGPSVGWFPLGPREVFVPGYRSSPIHVRNVNVTHVTNITNITQIINSPNSVVQQTNYLNRGIPGAMTVVPASVVSGRQPVAPARVQLTDPRPGAEPRVNVAGLQTLTAAPQIMGPAPPAPRPAGAPVRSPMQTGVLAPAGTAPAVGTSAAAAGSTVPAGVPIDGGPGRAVVPMSPQVQPAARGPRPNGEPGLGVPGADATLRPAAQPVPPVSQLPVPTRPALNPTAGLNQPPAARPPGPTVSPPSVAQPPPPPPPQPQPQPQPQQPQPQPQPVAAAPVAQPLAPAQVRQRALPMPPPPVEASRPAPPTAAPVVPVAPQAAAPAAPKTHPAPVAPAKESKEDSRERENPKNDRR